MSSLLKFANPRFYYNAFCEMQRRTAKELMAGSINPFFKGMLLVGVVGYFTKYTMIESKLKYVVVFF
jgi:hypothetical protein